MVAPYPVPDAGDESGTDEHDGSVVDSGGVDGDGGGHAEEWKGETRPGWEGQQLAGCLGGVRGRGGGSLTKSNDIGDEAKGSEVELAGANLLPASE